MSAPVSEGGQDDDDILGFPGDGFVDKTDVNPGVFGEQDEEGDDSRMDETGGASARNFSQSGREEDLTPHLSVHVHVCVFDHLPILRTGTGCFGD
jgi:hypothetical protein